MTGVEGYMTMIERRYLPVDVIGRYLGVNSATVYRRIDKHTSQRIVTNYGWKISLDRDLDIFQHYE
jgi:hypothetical protein